MALGAIVKRFREDAGLTQTQLAELAHMDQQALAALENRDSKSSKFTAALAAALGKSVDEMLGNSKSVAAAQRPENYIDADELILLITLYRQSSQVGRRLILESAQEAPKLSAARRSG